MASVFTNGSNFKFQNLNVDDLFLLTEMKSHLLLYLHLSYRITALPNLESDAIRYTDANGCSYLTLAVAMV